MLKDQKTKEMKLEHRITEIGDLEQKCKDFWQVLHKFDCTDKFISVIEDLHTPDIQASVAIFHL